VSDLLFRIPLDGSADLVLGRDGPPEGFVGHVSIHAPVPPVTATARVAVAYGAHLSAVLAGPTAHTVLQYRSETSRPTIGHAADAAQVASPQHGRAVEQIQIARPMQHAVASGWQAATPLARPVASRWSDGMRQSASTSVRWQRGLAAASRLAASYQNATHVRSALAGRFQSATPMATTVASAFQDALRDRRTRLAASYQDATRAAHPLASRAGPGVSLQSSRQSRFQNSRHPPPGMWKQPIVPPPGHYIPPAGDAVALLFREKFRHHVNLVFGRLGEPAAGQLIIPIRSTYIVINDVSLVRLPENTEIQAYSLSLKWDADSWSVGWSASLPATAMDAVMPSGIGEPIELLATINGAAVRLLAESIARDRRFGDARLNVSGRGRVAWLAAPYAPTVARNASAAMTAQQLAADALTENGVPIGWALDWQLADWLVPAGVWSHQGTMIDAVKRIAEAAGGYVLGHRTAQTLHVRPRYPLLPWEWAGATPDIVIPSAVASTEAITWSESPAYNRVFVAGQEQGRMGQITRSGTAGDIVAPMITDPLITHADAARARGASILAAGGRQASIALRLPVLPATGILDLGQLIEYQDGATARRGLVRAVSVEAGLPSVWQTVEIETHA